MFVQPAIPTLQAPTPQQSANPTALSSSPGFLRPSRGVTPPGKQKIV